MRITLTREDIKAQAAALERVEELEAWLKQTYGIAYLSWLNSNERIRVNAGCLASKHDKVAVAEEAIFRSHLTAAVREAIAYHKKRAGLEDES